MIKRLMQPTGLVATQEPFDGDSYDRCMRKAILVHSGPDGGPAVLYSADGELVFDVNRIKQIVEINNDHVAHLQNEYGGSEKTPIGAYPPILDIHVDESMDNVCGRLATNFWFEIRDVPKVGKNVACVMGNITFLGAQAVDAVRLGKFYHLSVGIDDNEKSDTYNLLGETSVVIEPAAPGAMLLKKGAKNMSGKKKAAAGKAPVKKNLTASQKALVSLKSEMKTLSAGVATAQKNLIAVKEKARLTQRQGIIKTNLSRLMAEKKLAPAEVKTINEKHLARLTAMGDADRELVFDLLGSRENIIEPGQRGSTGAVPFAQMGKELEKKQVKKLRTSIRESMIKNGAKLTAAAQADHDRELKGLSAEDDEGGKKKLEGKDNKKAAGRKILSEDEDEKDGKKDLEADKGDEVPGLESQGDPDMDDEDAQSMQQQIDELNTQVARIASLVEQIVDNDEDEVADDHEEGESELEAGDKDGDKDDKKDLESDPEKKDDKKDLEGKDDDEKKKLEAEQAKKDALKKAKKD